ncbi:CapA family protein [Lentisalinibacter salinarum]|uniref:CapA family protein n=1 Tax=Lentisalinibacter salinarum TaxID=2992239 RepID=UPI00386605D8
MVRLGFAGDLSLAVLNAERACGMEDLASQCKAFTKRVDIAVANLESIVVARPGECDRKMAVSADRCHGVEALGFHVFSLANNHILDCGQAGLATTEAFLRERGMRTVGAGSDLEKAEAPLFVETEGKRIGFLSVTDATHYGARSKVGGVAPLIPRRLVKSVRRLSRDVDLLLVSVHSDLEFTNFPAPWKVRLSRELVRAGAHLVIHHHPHTLQGIERYRGGLIAYSLGNFVFPVHGNAYMRGRQGYTHETVFLTVDVSWNRSAPPDIKYDVIAGIIDDQNRLQIAGRQDASRIIGRLHTYSEELDNLDGLRRKYFRMCVGEGKRFVMDLYYSIRKEGVRAGWRFILGHLSTSQHRNWMRGLLTFGRA